MQCNMSLHVISCHMHNECHMDNTIHTIYWCHGQSNHLHMTSIHHFIHVNISYKHISTFTLNMSFYDQEMRHTQASHVMAIAHNNSSHVTDKCKTHLCFEFISQAIFRILYPYSCKTHNISSKFGFLGFFMESK